MNVYKVPIPMLIESRGSQEDVDEMLISSEALPDVRKGQEVAEILALGAVATEPS